MVKFIKKIISYIYEIFKRSNTPNTKPAESRIDEQTSSGGTRDARKDGGVLDKETPRGGNSSTNTEHGGETKTPIEGGRGLDVWSFASVWNNNALAEQELKPKPRDWLRGSDLGKPMSDVFLKMKGEEYTNPPNDRSLRKFESGNLWEWIVKLILIRANLYISTQEDVAYQYAGLLKVTGHPDFLAGGKPDVSQAQKAIDELQLPPTFAKASKKVIEYLQEKYPNGLEEIVLEVKSTSGDFFNILERSGKALKIHRLQLYNYLKSMNKPKGAVIYISRDDARILSIPVLYPSAEIEKEYHDYIKQFTEYWNNNEMPPIEQPITFDEDMQRLKKNSMLSWSPYLKRLYGFESQADFDNIYTPLQAKFTRTLQRIADDKKMTPMNLKTIEEMKEMGFDPIKIAKTYYVKKDVGDTTQT